MTWKLHNGEGVPGVISGQNENDNYVNGLNGDLYQLTSGTWIKLGAFPIGSSATTDFRKEFVRINGGQWFDLIWKDADEVVFKCKGGGGFTPFVGAILPNTGTFLYSETDIIFKYDTPANSGHIIDGITAKLNNCFQRLYFYEDSGGLLAVGSTLMLGAAGDCTITDTNPTTELTLAQVNSQNIGYLFPVGARLVVWGSTTKFETPLYNTTGGYLPTGDLCVASRTATILTLDAALGVPNFSSGNYIYQVDGFKPVQVSDGAIASVIGTRGYKDTGIALRTDGSANIYPFHVSQDGNEFYYDNGSGAASYELNTGLGSYAGTTAYANYRMLFVPPDKCGIIAAYFANQSFYTKPYYQTYGDARTLVSAILKDETCILHGIFSHKNNVSGATILQRGYLR